MSSYVSSLQPFLTHNVSVTVHAILRQSIIFASGSIVAELALGKQCKRWATAALLDQPFNPVTLSLRQTACYRSFHYVFKQQIALQVRCTGRVKEKLPCQALLQPACTRNNTTICCTSKWGRLENGETSLDDRWWCWEKMRLFTSFKSCDSDTARVGYRVRS